MDAEVGVVVDPVALDYRAGAGLDVDAVVELGVAAAAVVDPVVLDPGAVGAPPLAVRVAEQEADPRVVVGDVVVAEGDSIRHAQKRRKQSPSARPRASGCA